MIVKSRSSDTLDGLDSTDFLRAYNITTTEFITGYKRNNKPVFGIELDLGALQLGTKEISFIFNSTFQYWIDNQNSFTESSSEILPLNYSGEIGEGISTKIDKTNNKIKIICDKDRSQFTKTKLILLYTKA